MTALLRPIRRLLGRSAPGPAPAPVAPAAKLEPAPVLEQPGVAVEIPESDPLFAFL